MRVGVLNEGTHHDHPHVTGHGCIKPIAARFPPRSLAHHTIPLLHQLARRSGAPCPNSPVPCTCARRQCCHAKHHNAKSHTQSTPSPRLAAATAGEQTQALLLRTLMQAAPCATRTPRSPYPHIIAHTPVPPHAHPGDPGVPSTHGHTWNRGSEVTGAKKVSR